MSIRGGNRRSLRRSQGPRDQQIPRALIRGLVIRERLAQIVASYSGWSWLHTSPERDADLSTDRPLSRISVPTLLMMGERDIEEFQAIANHITCSIPQLTKLILPGVGHMANMEAPEAFNEAVLLFLGSLKHHQLE